MDPTPIPSSDLPRHKPTDMELYTTLAEIALTYFNSNQGTNFNFVKLVNRSATCGPKAYIHLNFIATDNGGGGGDELPAQIFYAEIIRIWITDGISEDDSEDENEEDSEVESEDEEEYDTQVKGCALLEKVDTGNPLGRLCKICHNMYVIHPGPHSGYRVVAGDKFESSEFLEYNIYKVFESLHHESPRRKSWGPRSKIKHTADHLPMLTSCANLALQHFNHNERQSLPWCIRKQPVIGTLRRKNASRSKDVVDSPKVTLGRFLEEYVRCASMASSIRVLGMAIVLQLETFFRITSSWKLGMEYTDITYIIGFSIVIAIENTLVFLTSVLWEALGEAI